MLRQRWGADVEAAREIDLARACRQQAGISTDLVARDTLLEMAREYEAKAAADGRQALDRRPQGL